MFGVQRQDDSEAGTSTSAPGAHTGICGTDTYAAGH